MSDEPTTEELAEFLEARQQCMGPTRKSVEGNEDDERAWDYYSYAAQRLRSLEAERDRLWGTLFGDRVTETIAAAVHNAWWSEKKRQGKADDHPDAIPYDQLSESTKEYDRVTARAVVSALQEAAQQAGGDG